MYPFEEKEFVEMFVSPTGDAFCKACGQWDTLSLTGIIMKPNDYPLRFQYKCCRCQHEGFVGKSKEDGKMGVWS
jgi:hypothetical protein